MDYRETLKEMLASCMQCGTCTGSCPNSFAMDMTPRKLWRMVVMDRFDAIFRSQTFILCSTCYYCTLRCPRGLQLTRAMSLLKCMASQQDLQLYRGSVQFYKSFIESVRRHGRVRETEFLTLYLITMKNPMLALRFAGLGLKLMNKDKVRFQFPSSSTAGNLEAMFQKVFEIEDRK